MNKKTIVILIAVFLLGLAIGSSGNETKEVIVEKEASIETWRELKEVDDTALIIAGDQLGLCGDAFYSASVLDFDTLELIADQVMSGVEELESIGTRRRELLYELGY